MTRWLVVGAGTAGCVVASRLSEDESNEVTLLEAGSDHGAGAVEGDVGPFLDDPARLWPDTAVIRRPGSTATAYLQGRGLGGSSLINGAIVVANPDDADVEHLVPAELPSRHGAIGEAMLRAADDAHPVALARRGGLRVTVADAYIRPIIGQSNLTVAPDAHVDRLLVDGRRVGGALTTDGRAFVADRVVLCTGAIATPTIMLRSGVDTPGVGDGLQDHPAFSIAVELAAGAVDANAPAITAAIDRPGRQIMAMNHLPALPTFGALVPGLMSVTSVGRVSLPDRAGVPRVELNALATSADIDGLVAATLEALDLVEHRALRSVVTAAFVDEHGTPTSKLIGDEAAVRAWLPDHLSGYHHVAASCRMGVVTDELGRVDGYEGLFVCDASLFPGVPTINPYLSVVTLAERLAGAWRNASAAP